MAFLLSDPVQCWSSEISRDSMMQKVIDSIESWPIDADEIDFYDSFTRYLNFLQLNHSPASRFFAIWEIANRTTVKRKLMIIIIHNSVNNVIIISADHYCSILIKEDGILLLETLMNEDQQTIPDKWKNWINVILQNVQKWYKLLF